VNPTGKCNKADKGGGTRKKTMNQEKKRKGVCFEGPKGTKNADGKRVARRMGT